jgi:hypothetical protein
VISLGSRTRNAASLSGSIAHANSRVFTVGTIPRIGEYIQSALGGYAGSKKMSRFFFAVFIVAGLFFTAYFGAAAWRLSDESRGDVTGQIRPATK